MRKISIGIIAFITLYFIGIIPVWAADGLGCGEGFGFIAQILCPIKKGDTAVVGGQLNTLISTIIGVMTVVAAIWFIFQFITAGYQWISSGGDKNNLQQARDKITNSVIGLVIVVAAWIVIGVIGKIIGLDIINPGQILINLGK